MKTFVIALFMMFVTAGLTDTYAANELAQPFSKQAGKSYLDLKPVKKGGTIYGHLLGNPKVLNPILKTVAEETNVVKYIYAWLMDMDQATGEYFPSLAEKLDVTKDYKSITFTLRAGASWEDGTPVTSDDAEFTFKTIMDPKVESAPMKPYFEGMKFTKLDDRRFRFDIENPDINTIPVLCSTFILVQKKQFENESNFNRSKGALAPIGNGPYRLKQFSRDQKIELERNKNWWGFKLPHYQGAHNFDQIVLRIIPDAALAHEKLVKGDIDAMQVQAEPFGAKIRGSDKDKFGTAPNSGKSLWASPFKTDFPPALTYIGWNLKRPQFKSKKTRQALAHLVDYQQVIDQIYYGLYQRSVSPFGTNTANTSPEQRARAFKFDSKKGLAMLKEDGWADTDSDGVIDKMIEGKKVKFEFMIRYNSENPMRAKVAQMLKEQLKKAGIVVNVQSMEWNSYVAQIDKRDFDAIVMGWAKGFIHPDAKQIWHTDSYAGNGSNFGGYSNPEVDALIALTKKELNAAKRFKMMQKMGAMIYDDQPYVFLAELPGFLAAYNSRIKAQKWFMRYDDIPPIWLMSAE